MMLMHGWAYIIARNSSSSSAGNTRLVCYALDPELGSIVTVEEFGALNYSSEEAQRGLMLKTYLDLNDRKGSKSTIKEKCRSCQQRRYESKFSHDGFRWYVL